MSDHSRGWEVQEPGAGISLIGGNLELHLDKVDSATEETPIRLLSQSTLETVY